MKTSKSLSDKNGNADSSLRIPILNESMKQVQNMKTLMCAAFIAVILLISGAVTSVEAANTVQSSNQGASAAQVHPDYTKAIGVYLVFSVIFVALFRVRLRKTIVVYLVLTVLVVRYGYDSDFVSGILLILLPAFFLIFSPAQVSSMAQGSKALGDVFKN